MPLCLTSCGASPSRLPPISIKRRCGSLVDPPRGRGYTGQDSGVWPSLVRAPGSGPGGRQFKSAHPDHLEALRLLAKDANPCPETPGRGSSFTDTFTDICSQRPRSKRMVARAQDEAPTVTAKIGPPRAEVANALGIGETTLREAEQHVAAVEDLGAPHAAAEDGAASGVPAGGHLSPRVGARPDLGHRRSLVVTAAGHTAADASCTPGGGRTAGGSRTSRENRTGQALTQRV